MGENNDKYNTKSPLLMELLIDLNLHLQFLEQAVTPTIIFALANDCVKYDHICQKDGVPPRFFCL